MTGEVGRRCEGLDVNFDEVCLCAWCVLVCIRGASVDAYMYVRTYVHVHFSIVITYVLYLDYEFILFVQAC